MNPDLFLTVLTGVLLTLGFALAAALASFACVVGERVPAGHPVTGRSHCVCGRQLTARENIPVAGWVRARGVARCCGSRIPTRYVLAETGAGLAGLAVTGHVLDALTRDDPAGAGWAALSLAGAPLLVAALTAALTVLERHEPGHEPGSDPRDR